jgi:hypothetical protein
LSIKRVLHHMPLALVLAVPVVAAGAPADAAAVQPACTSDWTTEGSGSEAYAHDELGRRLSVGEVFQQYDYCQHVRGVFEWESSFRTQAHEGISAAYATVELHSSNASRSTGPIGSGAGPVILTPTLAVDGLEWTLQVTVTLDYRSGTDYRACRR